MVAPPSRPRTGSSSPGRSGSSVRGLDTPLPCPAGPPRTPALTRTRSSSRRRLAVEDLLDHGPRPPGRAAVVLDELTGVGVRPVAAGAGHADQLRAGAGQLVARPAADPEEPIAGPR